MGERLRERDPGDQLLVRAQRRLKGKTILFLDQLVFFSCSQGLGSSSAPRWTCRTGLPPPPLTRVSFIILDVKRGPVNKTTGVNQDFLGKSGCPKPPLPTGEMQRAAQPSGDLREDGGGAGARGHQAHEVHVLSGEGAGA